MILGVTGDTQALLFRLRALVPAHTRTIGAHIHMDTDAHAHMGHTTDEWHDWVADKRDSTQDHRMR